MPSKKNDTPKVTKIKAAKKKVSPSKKKKAPAKKKSITKVNVRGQKKSVGDNRNKNLYVVGIGTSAGGLEALQELFGNCPADTGMAFVIVQHLSPDYKSLMPELLSRHTPMKVNEAREGEVVEANHVYLIPGSKNLTISNGKLQLSQRPPSTAMNFSIDIFFHSLAAEQKEKSIAVILSGTGSDGTRGGKSIKEVGGTVFVQMPESSRFDGMPRSAINNGLADYILQPEEMPDEIVQYITHPQFSYNITANELGKNVESIDRILKILKNHTGYDFFSYKKPTLLRRTAKRMNITKNDTAQAYIDYLYDHPEEKFILVDEFLIGVTKFFRDTEAYKIIEKNVIPDIVDKKASKKLSIKLWVVACSTGEEAYSLAILLEEYMSAKNLKVNYKIFATDIDGKSIDHAAKGIYNENIATDVSQKRLAKYFINKDRTFQILPSIRKNIIFSKHDILQNPPFNKMDLISCRNMLIYLDNKVQVKVLSNLHYALNQNGYLFMGSSENIGVLNKSFEEVNNKWRIYRNVHPTRVVNITKSEAWQIDSNRGYSRNKRAMFSMEEKVNKTVNNILTKHTDAVSICIDENYEILHAVGELKKYIEVPEVGFSNNLLKILPDELGIPITTAIRKAAKVRDELIVKNVKLIIHGNLIHIKVLVRTIGVVNAPAFLVTFIQKHQRELTEKERTETIPSIEVQTAEVSELKEALNETRENLQATIEELETSNEEMQATNEELLASNEELQSTNEELQSLNEELHTVNAELQEKNTELLVANADIENLMTNVNIGTIFLDRDLNIRKFTPTIREHFQLKDEDISRPIEHFSGNLGKYNLAEEAKKVMKSLKAFRGEFTNKDGVWFMLQIFPYKTQDHTIKGVVVNFININELKKANSEAERWSSYIEQLGDSSAIAFYVYKMKTFERIYSTSSVLEICGYPKREVKNLSNTLMLRVIHPEDLIKLQLHRKAVGNALNNNLHFVELRVIHKKTKEFVWILLTEKVHTRDSKGNVESVMGIAQDVTHSKQLELELQASNERSKLALQGTGAGLWEWSDIRQDKAWWSKQFYKLLNHNPKKLEASYGAMLTFVHPDYVELFQETLENHFATKAPFELELQINTNKKGYRWFRINAQASWDLKDRPTKVVGTIVDIDESQRMEQLIAEKEERLSAIYYHAPVGFLLLDKEGKIFEASEGVTKILGYTRKDLTKKHFKNITFKEDWGESNKQFKKLENDEIPLIKIDKRYMSKSRETIWTQTIVKKVEMKAGTNTYLAIISNISDRKVSEQKLKKLNEELERFAYLASHDLKEPLRTISSLTERLKTKHSTQLNKGAIKYVDLIESASNRMESLTKELLAYSQIGQKNEKIQNVNLNKVLKQIVKNLGNSISENNATIEVEKLPSIKGDMTQLELLFQNLISNGIKYRKKVNPKVKVGYSDEGTHWQFYVKDNGIGIKKEFHEKIFEVFQRLHNRNEYEGTGIGLSICKRIVETHAGRIWVKSVPRKGATFFFTLPKKLKEFSK